jgi:hypothetical protein
MSYSQSPGTHVMKRIFALLSLLAAAALAPATSMAVPMTWSYTGTCTAGDCGVISSITGTLSGDPAAVFPADRLTHALLFGELTSFSWTLGSYSYSGTMAVGEYRLDPAGNIVSGSMLFGDAFALEFLDVGSARWSFLDFDLTCGGFLGLDCKTSKIEASGTGSYRRVVAVPEPSLLSMIALGLLGVGFAARRRRPKA